MLRLKIFAGTENEGSGAGLLSDTQAVDLVFETYGEEDQQPYSDDGLAYFTK